MKMVPALLLAILFGLLLTWPRSAGAVENLDARTAAELLQRDKKIFLLDVRTPAEYREIRLAGAVLIPIDQVIARQGEIPRNRPILVYCAVGMRSSQVAAYLSRQDYGPIFNLAGGIQAWQASGLPVLQGAPQE